MYPCVLQITCFSVQNSNCRTAIPLCFRYILIPTLLPWVLKCRPSESASEYLHLEKVVSLVTVTMGSALRSYLLSVCWLSHVTFAEMQRQADLPEPHILWGRDFSHLAPAAYALSLPRNDVFFYSHLWNFSYFNGTSLPLDGGVQVLSSSFAVSVVIVMEFEVTYISCVTGKGEGESKKGMIK